MKNQPPPKPEPPKPCPVCSVAMQTTDEERHIVHRCQRCGTVIMIARPTMWEIANDDAE
jgi:uncharacterized Zn finger protein